MTKDHVADHLDRLAADIDRSLEEMTGRAPPIIMFRRRGPNLIRWMTREDGEPFVTMLRPPYDSEDDIPAGDEIDVSVQELIAFAEENGPDFHLFLKRRRWD